MEEKWERVFLKDIHDGYVTNLDLYFLLEGKPILFVTKNHVWNQQEIDNLFQDGHTFLVYHKEDSEKFFVIEEKLKKIKNLEPEKKILEINEIAADFNRWIYKSPLDEKAIHHVGKIAEVLVETLVESPSSVKCLGLLAHHDYYTYYHSSRVSSYAVATAYHSGMSNFEELKKLALGCLLHDIGKSKIDMNIINKPSELNKDEWKIIRQHPEMGWEMIENSSIDSKSKKIVLSHHERLDGKGYPFGLNKKDIIDEVRIASLADVFDALTTNRSYQASRSKYEALQKIKFNLLEGIDEKFFRSMVALFA